MAALVARELRRNATDAECVLWSKLRDRRLEGWKFKRQAPRGPYVVDFICLTARLIIEVDGGQHALREKEDGKRTAWLQAEGFRIIRFWNNEVLENLDGVLQSILIALQEAPSPHPSPRGGEGVVQRTSTTFDAPSYAGGPTASTPDARKRQESATQQGEHPLPAGGEGRGEGAPGAEAEPRAGSLRGGPA